MDQVYLLEESLLQAKQYLHHLHKPSEASREGLLQSNEVDLPTANQQPENLVKVLVCLFVKILQNRYEHAEKTNRTHDPDSNSIDVSLHIRAKSLVIRTIFCVTRKESFNSSFILGKGFAVFGFHSFHISTLSLNKFC